MLTGDMNAKCFFVFFGKGNNGKSVIMRLLEKITKKFYCQASEDVFVKQKHQAGQASPHFLHCWVNVLQCMQRVKAVMIWVI